MKKIFITLVCALISAGVYAQHNFSKTEAGNVIWQQIFENDVDINTFYEHMVNSGRYHDILISGNSITCWLNESPIEYARLGYKTGNIPMVLSTNNITAFITVQFKDARYRVTLEQIQFIQSYKTKLYDRGDVVHMDTFALDRKGQIKKIVASDTFPVLDKCFTDLFEYKKASHLSDSW